MRCRRIWLNHGLQSITKGVYDVGTLQCFLEISGIRYTACAMSLSIRTNLLQCCYLQGMEDGPIWAGDGAFCFSFPCLRILLATSKPSPTP